MTVSRSDALVLFGVTGDLAHKMIFPALYAMVKRDTLKVPVVGVASPKWSLAQLRDRVRDSITQSGGIDDQRAFDQLFSLLSYVSGDYKDQGTFAKIKEALVPLAVRRTTLPFRLRSSRRSLPGSVPRTWPTSARHRRKAIRPRFGLGA